MALTVRPRIKLPWSVSFPTFINALSIPLIAGILVWLLMRVLEPGAWCPALEEFKLTNAATIVQLRCQPILMAQLDIAKFVAIGLVGALSLSHLVSVVREAKAGIELATKLGTLRIGDGSVASAAKAGAEHVEEAAVEAAKEVGSGEASIAPQPAPEAPQPATATPEATAGLKFTNPPGEEQL